MCLSFLRSYAVNKTMRPEAGMFFPYVSVTLSAECSWLAGRTNGRSKEQERKLTRKDFRNEGRAWRCLAKRSSSGNEHSVSSYETDALRAYGSLPGT